MVFIFKPQLLQTISSLPTSSFSTNSPATINPFQPNPELITFNVEKTSEGIKIFYKDYSVTFIPYFVMKSGAVYTWKDIPSTIQKDLWRTKIDETHYKYGVNFNNVSNQIKNNLNYVVLQRVNSTGLTWDDVRLEGNTIIIKDRVYISHDDILSTYTIPLINKTDIVIGGLDRTWQECIEVNPETLDCISEVTRSNWVSNGATWNISFDPTITISEASVIPSSILTNVTAETNGVNFTHLNISTTAPYDKLIGYWNFDGDIENGAPWSNFTIYDFSKNNRDGEAKVRTAVNLTNCIYGDCVKFNGDITFTNRSYVDLTNKWTFTGNQSLTIMMWAYPLNQPSSGDGRMLQSSTTCVFRISGTRSEFILNSFTGTTDRVISAPGSFPLNTWTHVVGMYDNSTNNLSVWINGVMSNSTTPDGNYGTCSAWTLGGQGGPSVGYYNGSIDEFMVFNNALTGTQVLAIYQNQSARFFNSGTQRLSAVSTTNDTTWNNNGYNRINVSTSVESELESSISLRIGKINLTTNYTLLNAFYPFETASQDLIGGFNGTENGGVYWNETGGRGSSGAYNFDGINDYIDINDLDLENKFSISAWVKIKNFQGTPYVISKLDTSVGNYSYGLFFNATGNLGLLISSDSGADNMEWAYTTQFLETNRWYHVVGMWNGTNMFLVINGTNYTGAPEGNPVTSVFNNGVDAMIGGMAPAYASMNGTIDNLLVYNRTLSQAEITTLYNDGTNVDFTPYQNITSDVKNLFNISKEADFIFLDYLQQSSPYAFYSPLINGSITLESWYVEEEEVPITISILRIDTATEVNATKNEFFNTTLNITCLTGSCGTINVSLHYNNLEGWNISSAGFIQNKTIASSEANPTGIYLRDDGLRGYIIGLTSDKVFEYNLSTAWNTSTISNTRNFSTATQDANAQGIFFKPDGTKMYILGGDGDDVNEYNLTNAWNVSSTIYNQLFSVATQDISPTGIFFKPDGLKMYIVGLADNVSEYTLSLAWNVGSATFSKGFSFATEEDFSTDVFFRSDGLKMYISGNENDEIHEYNLSTAWDISTADYLRLYDTTTEETNPNGIFFNNYGTKFYIAGVKSGISQYNIPAIEERGLISTTTGAIPFYTNSTNPLTTSSLNSGQSELITFWVNATGNIDNVYEFFAFANVTSDLTISNISSYWNVTIIEGEAPADTCTYASGNWNVNCADNCIITSNVDLGWNNITFINIGLFNIQANITSIKRKEISAGCIIFINSGNKF